MQTFRCLLHEKNYLTMSIHGYHAITIAAQFFLLTCEIRRVLYKIILHSIARTLFGFELGLCLCHLRKWPRGHMQSYIRTRGRTVMLLVDHGMGIEKGAYLGGSVVPISGPHEGFQWH